ncbi:MAG: hypothetical protein F6K50_37880 [Moorea sp. SIO3I7]|nr:hypothetical protein [Moorena sp. SIO3I7]NEO47398.1 hypothetical protein [Moorena sp. SIO4A3]
MIEQLSMTWAMATNTLGWAKTDVNSGMFGSWKAAFGILVGGHCSDEFCQGWGLISSNAHQLQL